MWAALCVFSRWSPSSSPILNLGPWNVVVALVIALIKASLVAWIFMGVRFTSKLTRLFVVAGLGLAVHHDRDHKRRLRNPVLGLSCAAMVKRSGLTVHTLRRIRPMRFAVLFIFLAIPVMAAGDVPVPSECTPQVNARLANLIHAAQTGQSRQCDGLRSRHAQLALRERGHHRFSVLAHTPEGDELIEIDSNDQLDGAVTAQKRRLDLRLRASLFRQYVTSLRPVFMTSTVPRIAAQITAGSWSMA